VQLTRGQSETKFLTERIVYNLVSFNAGFRAVVKKTHFLLTESNVHLIATKRRTVLKLVNFKIRKPRCS
jgi:hypothetical protein